VSLATVPWLPRARCGVGGGGWGGISVLANDVVPVDDWRENAAGVSVRETARDACGSDMPMGQHNEHKEHMMETPAPRAPEMVGTPAVSSELGVCLQTARNLIRRGVLPAIRVGRQLRVKRTDLEIYKARGMGMTIVAGQPEVGKSFEALALVLAATGAAQPE
jgi:excisionase family DNA binding protein